MTALIYSGTLQPSDHQLRRRAEEVVEIIINNIKSIHPSPYDTEDVAPVTGALFHLGQIIEPAADFANLNLVLNLVAEGINVRGLYQPEPPTIFVNFNMLWRLSGGADKEELQSFWENVINPRSLKIRKKGDVPDSTPWLKFLEGRSDQVLRHMKSTFKNEYIRHLKRTNFDG